MTSRYSSNSARNYTDPRFPINKIEYPSCMGIAIENIARIAERNIFVVSAHYPNNSSRYVLLTPAKKTFELLLHMRKQSEIIAQVANALGVAESYMTPSSTLVKICPRKLSIAHMPMRRRPIFASSLDRLSPSHLRTRSQRYQVDERVPNS